MRNKVTRELCVTSTIAETVHKYNSKSKSNILTLWTDRIFHSLAVKIKRIEACHFVSRSNLACWHSDVKKERGYLMCSGAVFTKR